MNRKNMEERIAILRDMASSPPLFLLNDLKPHSFRAGLPVRHSWCLAKVLISFLSRYYRPISAFLDEIRKSNGCYHPQAKPDACPDENNTGSRGIYTDQIMNESGSLACTNGFCAGTRRPAVQSLTMDLLIGDTRSACRRHHPVSRRRRICRRRHPVCRRPTCHRRHLQRAAVPR